MKPSKIKVVTAVRVRGKLYRTPKAACKAWAWAFWVERCNRQALYLLSIKGERLYTDNEWYARPVIKNYARIAMRRAMPIFNNIFGVKP